MHLSLTMDEPKALSSLLNDTIDGVSMKGVQIEEPSVDGETCGGILTEIVSTFKLVVLCTAMMTCIDHQLNCHYQEVQCVIRI